MLQFTWREAAHINELEVRAYLSAFRWRLHKASNIGPKFLHLLDSQVSIGVRVKQRSSNRRLNRVARKAAALDLASGSLSIFAFVRWADIPADAPSRKSSSSWDHG